MKPKLKPPGAKRLKLKCDVLLSTSAFKCNLRRYNVVGVNHAATGNAHYSNVAVFAPSRNLGLVAGAYTRPLFSST